MKKKSVLLISFVSRIFSTYFPHLLSDNHSSIHGEKEEDHRRRRIAEEEEEDGRRHYQDPGADVSFSPKGIVMHDPKRH